MSRLWIDHHTDSRGHGGKERASVSICYGSLKDSKLAIRIEVTYNKEDEHPTVHFTLGENTKFAWEGRSSQ